MQQPRAEDSAKAEDRQFRLTAETAAELREQVIKDLDRWLSARTTESPDPMGPAETAEAAPEPASDDASDTEVAGEALTDPDVEGVEASEEPNEAEGAGAAEEIPEPRPEPPALSIELLRGMMELGSQAKTEDFLALCSGPEEAESLRRELELGAAERRQLEALRTGDAGGRALDSPKDEPQPTDWLALLAVDERNGVEARVALELPNPADPPSTGGWPDDLPDDEPEPELEQEPEQPTQAEQPPQTEQQPEPRRRTIPLPRRPPIFPMGKCKPAFSGCHFCGSRRHARAHCPLPLEERPRLCFRCYLRGPDVTDCPACSDDYWAQMTADPEFRETVQQWRSRRTIERR